QTKSCRLPAVGHYVWVETIDPADTPIDKGRDRVRPWKSPFGVASEVTLVPVPPVEPVVPTIMTRVEQPSVEPGTCVTDGLEVTGLDPALGVSFEVESLLVGPFRDEVADGHDLRGEFDQLPLVGTITTTVTGNGAYETDCVKIPDDGHYVFVFRSAGSAPDPDGDQVVGPFSDLVAHRSEMVKAKRPDVPPPPPTTPPTTPVSPPPTVPPALAFTGSRGIDTAIVAGLGALMVGGLALVGSRAARRSRMRRASLVEMSDEQGDA
ncbi:MAG: hypothetical protein JWP75_3771, partial [Frondihabitans sp.]|nr:hypothetical protein [Frondihabitans sp.]